MEHTKIASNLYLVSQNILHESKSVLSGNVNHIWIYDRSGSMYSTLRELCTHMKVLIRHLKPGDIITLMWFSGENQHGTILKGTRINSIEDYVLIDKVIEKHNTTVGSTCFSEILTELYTTINDISVFSDTIAVTLFTDGYPVVSNLTQELNNINNALLNIKEKITAMLFIGYGDYYNRELMLDMAKKVDGACIHNNDLKEWGMSITKFIENMENNKNPKTKVSIDIPNNQIKGIFTIQNGSITNLKADEHNTVRVYGNKLYFLTNEPHGLSVESDKNIEGILAASIYYNQLAKTYISMDILGKLGDKYLLDLLSNAYTNQEYGKAELAILEAINNPSLRFKNGKDINCRPDANAFCVLELITMLMDDNEALFFPRHPEFQYKRIGRNIPQKEGYPTVKADKDVAVPLSSLTWHDSKLNLSILTKIPGTVTLNDQEGVTPESVGFIREFPTFIWRNYTLIKDGVVNVTRFPVKLGGNNFLYFSQLGIIENPNTEDGIYILNLSGLPLITWAMVQDRSSAKELATNSIRKLRLDAHTKVLRDILKTDEVNTNQDTLNDIRLKFLYSNGIKKDGGFSPPTRSLDKALDFYMAKSFSIKIKGASTLPKVSEVIDKITTKKTLNLPAKFMAEMLSVPKMDALHLLEIKKRELKKIRHYIQETKFVMVLSKKWFDEFKTRNDKELKYLDVVDSVNIETSIIFNIQEEKVAID